MLRLRDIMRAELFTVSPDTTLYEVMELLANRRVSGLPVVDENGEAIGVASATDVIRHITKLAKGGEQTYTQRLAEAIEAEAFEERWWEWAEAGALSGITPAQARETKVSRIMTPMAYTLGPDSPVVEAAGAMYRGAMHRVLVTQNGRLVGIVTTTDIVKAVADGRLVSPE